MRDIPGVISRPPTLITRRHIDVDNPANFQYVWKGPKPSGFRKSNRKVIHDSIQDIINNLSSDDSQTESSQTVSRKAYKISGIYTIPKMHKEYEDHTINEFDINNYQSRYVSPMYALKTVSPLEINWMAPGSSSHPLEQKRDYIDQFNIPVNRLKNYSLRYAHDNNQNLQSRKKLKVPMSLLLDIVPDTDDDYATGKSRGMRHKMQYLDLNSIHGVLYKGRSQQYNIMPMYQNINYKKLHQRFQNDYYNMYYQNKYFQNNGALNYDRRYHINIPVSNKENERMPAKRMVIHLNLIPDDNDASRNK